MKRNQKQRGRTTEREDFAKMEEETAFADLSDFEFALAIYQDPSDKLRLPDKFAELLDGREPHELKLGEAGGGHRLWDVEVVFDGDGHMYLGHGWDQFAREYGLQPGHFLVFSYDGDAMLTVKVFDGTMCRRHYHYQHDDDASTTPVPRSLQLATVKEEYLSTYPGSESSNDSTSNNSIDSGSNDNSSSSAEMDIDDAPASRFTVMLRQCHLGVRQKQYLNVPVDFQVAHEYHKRSKVVLRMRGKSWPVTVKHTSRSDGHPRTSLRYGWHQFCVDNRLGVGDTCFFQALRESGEDHELKVEVRRRDGTFAD